MNGWLNNIDNENVVAGVYIGIVLMYISIFVGFWWSIVEFLLYLFKDSAMNWTPVWLLGVPIFIFIVFFVLMIVGAFKGWGK